MALRQQQGYITRATKNPIEVNNDLFGQRLREFNCSAEGKRLRSQLKAIRKRFFEAYRQAALDHWKENGTDASTGWGCTPEGKYQTPRKVSDCAYELANKLEDTVVEHPDWTGNGYE